MDSLEELKNSSSQQLRNRFEALHNLLESYEKDYIILKSNIFMNRARRAVYYDFDSNSWENYAEQYFDSHQQQLISSKNNANARLNKFAELAAANKDKGFDWSTFFGTALIGAVAYFLLKSGWNSVSLFWKIVLLVIGAFLVITYVVCIVNLCGYNYQAELADASRNQKAAQEEYSSAKEQFCKDFVNKEWEKHISQPKEQNYLQQAANQTRAVLQEFNNYSIQLTNEMHKLPAKYRYTYYIEELYEITSNGEANTWKECTDKIASNLTNERLSNIEKNQQETLKILTNMSNNQAQMLELQKKTMQAMDSQFDKISELINKQTEMAANSFNQIIDNQRKKAFQDKIIGTAVIGEMSSIKGAISNISPTINNTYYYGSPYNYYRYY